MATSNSVDFTVNRDTLIYDSFYDVGVLAVGQTAEADVFQHAVRKLNMMLKAWQTDGLQLWTWKDSFLVLEKGVSTYNLGPTGNHCTLSLTKTAMRVAAIAAATTMEIDSSSGMLAADYIGIELNTGETHWTTIASVTDGDTLVITSGIPAGKAAAIDNSVFSYRTKINRPLMISDLYIRDDAGNDRPVNLISYNEYNYYGSKTSQSDASQFVFDPQTTNARFIAYPVPGNGTSQCIFRGKFPIQDMDETNNTFDCPQEWLLAIQTGLSVLLTPAAATTTEEFKKLVAIATTEKERVSGFDRENNTSLYVQPSRVHS